MVTRRMRLVIDLQGAQSTGSRHRGIGRYSLALAEAMVRRAADHEVWIALNGAFADTIEPIRATFDTLVPQERIVKWDVPTPVGDADLANAWRRQTGEILRESFLANLRPDILHVSSLFEGLGDDAVTSVGAYTGDQATAITLYDLIPLIYKDPYLTNPVVETWYQRKLTSMRRAGLWLAISESSRREGIDWLGLPPDKVVNISTAADARFRPVQLPEEQIRTLRHRYGLTRPFVMYTGGIDHRKNIDGLISAYAQLPIEIRSTHQLAIVCAAHRDSIDGLMSHAVRQGLDASDLVFTGFVPDDDLLLLYNICKAFCFPSWHEGFGLPALEAMQCGAAVIGSNTSSIPEVIGYADALFDPRNISDIASRLHQVLVDEGYRRSLSQHSLQQARRFTWEESARRAWAAFEDHYCETQKARTCTLVRLGTKPRLAYVSPLPPERSGIADYSAEILPELARHYDIDVIVDQVDVCEPWIRANCQVRDIGWFKQNVSRYDRILYHFGNSSFHQHMFELADQYPGVVVLHDFYLSGIIAHMDAHNARPGLWSRALYESHGYHAVSELCHTKDVGSIAWKYPANVPALRNAIGVIVHSNYSRQLARQYYDCGFSADWAVVPLCRRSPGPSIHADARKALGFGESDFVVCSFGVIGPIKLNHRLLQAWLESSLGGDQDSHLVFVGEEHGGDYGTEMRRSIDNSSARERIHITGFAAPEIYRQYLLAADVAVQLRALSRGETSAAVLDCMAHGLPTIVNAHGAMAELPENCVIMLPDEFTTAQLVEALEALRNDPEGRRSLGRRAAVHVKKDLSPRHVADRYHVTIEDLYENSSEAHKRQTVAALAAVDPAHNDEQDWLALARALSRNLPMRRSQNQLLVDVSELVQRDSRTGIQRVTRGMLKALLANPPAGYRVEPVYATVDKLGYRYARKFTREFLSCSSDVGDDESIELHQGDIFLGLDLQPDVVPAQSGVYSEMRDAGIKIYFMVYDLLPILLPNYFREGNAASHARWLSIISEYADGLVCISRSVADELSTWLHENGPERARSLGIQWIHLGSDIENSAPTYGVPNGAEETLRSLRACPSFLVVGTIEPRKGHMQTLAAFETLWSDGIAANLVIVGKQGWMTEAFIERLHAHPELNKRLFWITDASDEYLEKIYEASACLLAPSEGEGFGLPLIEAARHRVSVLARDIPVFREVAGEHASYFHGSKPDDLARAIIDWLALYAKGVQPRSDNMPWLTWAESAEQLKTVLAEKKWYRIWPHDQHASPQGVVGHDRADGAVECAVGV